MPKVMESEPLTRFQSKATLEGGGTNLVCGHYAGAQRLQTLQLERREYPVVGFGIRLFWFQPRRESASRPREAGNSEIKFQRQLDDTRTGIGAEDAAKIPRSDHSAGVGVERCRRDIADGITLVGVVECIEQVRAEF
jgi:hypothetical protein